MKTKDFRELELDIAEKCKCDKDFIIAHLQKIEALGQNSLILPYVANAV